MRTVQEARSGNLAVSRSRRKIILAYCWLLLLAAGVVSLGACRNQPQTRRFVATAYSLEGPTASGKPVRVGLVAADPAVLPLGSKIRVHDAGRYSADYVVRDTGSRVKGHRIDIYVPDVSEAKRFGRREVRVEVLSMGCTGLLPIPLRGER